MPPGQFTVPESTAAGINNNPGPFDMMYAIHDRGSQAAGRTREQDFWHALRLLMLRLAAATVTVTVTDVLRLTP